MTKPKLLYIPKYKILYEFSKDGGYYPILYNCEKLPDGSYNGETINPNSIIGNWVMYVRTTFKTPSKNSSKVIQGNLYLYQWYLSIQIILSVMSFKGDKFSIMACRQVGRICPSI